ncbi:MAG TPA: HU family DNA-binding protein [Paludibacter sp.]
MNKEKISLQEIVDLVASSASISKRAAEEFLKVLFSSIEEALLAGEVVKIKNFGTFKLQWNEPRKSVNIQTGEEILLAGYNKVSFTPDAILKDLVNEPFAHLKPVQLEDRDGEMIEDDQTDVALDPLRIFTEQASEIKGLISEIQALSSNKLQNNHEDKSLISNANSDEIESIQLEENDSDEINPEHVNESELVKELEHIKELERVKELEIAKELELANGIEHVKELELAIEFEQNKQLELAKELERVKELERIKELERAKALELAKELDQVKELELAIQLEQAKENELSKVLEQAKELAQAKEQELAKELNKANELEINRLMDKSSVLEKVFEVPFTQSRVTSTSDFKESNANFEPIEDNSTNPFLENAKSRRKSKSWLWIPIALLLLIVSGLTIYLFYTPANNLLKSTFSNWFKPDSNQISETVIVPKDLISADSANFADSLNSKKPVDSLQILFDTPRVYPEFIAMERIHRGSRLTRMAKRYYGTSDFWVYIYEANMNRLHNPDKIPTGTLIHIPKVDPRLIDATNPRCINKARELHDLYVK